MLEIPFRGKRSSLQDRSERCLYLSTAVHGKFREICMVGKSFRVSLPLFWIRACSQDIFKTIKGTNSTTEAVSHSSGDISQRYSSDAKDVLEELLMSSLNFLLQHLDFWYPHHGFGTNRGKDGKGNFEISESPFLPAKHCFGIDKIDRSDVLNYPSSSTRSSTSKVFTTTTNRITKSGLFIPGRYSIKESVKTWTSLVGGKFKIKKWKITKAKGTKFSNKNWCSKTRLGSLLQQGVNWVVYWVKI